MITAPSTRPTGAGTNSNRNLGGLSAILPAIAFGVGFVWVVFLLFPLEEWKDLFSYVQRYSLDPYYGSTPPTRPLDYLAGEHGWQLLIQFVFDRGLQFDTAFFLISIFSLSLTAYTILKRTRDPLLLVVMANPAMIDFFASQVRSALAFSVVFWAVVNCRLPTKIAVILAAALIHTSMVLLLVPVGLSVLLDRFPSTKQEAQGALQHTGALIAVLIAFALANIQYYLLDFLGDRRAVYTISDLGAGFLYTMGWALVGLVFYILQKKRASLESIAAMFFFSMFFFASVYEFYAHRYIPYAVPFAAVAIGGAEVPKIKRYLFLAFFFAFSLIYFSYWA